MLVDVTAAAGVVVVVKVENSRLELFVSDPEANVPGHQPSKRCTESLVKGLESLIPTSFEGTGECTTVTALGTVHKPEIQIPKIILPTFQFHGVVKEKVGQVF